MTFTIKDNLNLFSIPDPAAPILLPASDNFIAADTIDSNLPIFSLFRNPDNPSQDPFVNFLYANLRIKKLLEEYTKVQKQANALLSNTYQDKTMSLMTGTSTYQQKKPPPANNKQNYADAASDSILQDRPPILIASTARSLGVYVALNNYAAVQYSKNAIISLHELQATFNKNNKPMSMPLSKTTGNSTPSWNFTYRQQAGPISEPPFEQQPNEQLSKNTFKKVSFRQGIINLRAELFNLLSKQKMPSLFLGLLALISLKIIFTPRS